jgi:hypothetical protein
VDAFWRGRRYPYSGEGLRPLSAEAIAGWGLDRGTGWCGEGEPHMTRYGYDATDLAAAFGRVRARLGKSWFA